MWMEIKLRMERMKIDKEYILKVVFAVALLFILFLWSGGVYEIKQIGRILIKINKFTGAIYVPHNHRWELL